MYQKKALDSYKQNSIATATPAELTMMLYNGAIKFMNIGKLAIEEDNISGRNENLLKAQDIISELRSSLDPSYDFSEDLMGLYDFVLEKIIDANINNSGKDLDEAITIVQDMRNTWAEVVKLSKKGQ